MSISVKQSTPSYWEASLLGAGRGLLSLVIEHPMDTVKTRCQSLGGDISVLTTARKIFAEQGLAGFYSGCVPNGIRLMSKQAYRYPMMMGFPLFFRNAIPNDWQQSYPSVVKLSTAVSIANFETFILCPLERLKVFLMTANAIDGGMLKFFRSNGGHLRQELSRGLGAVYMRQMTAWVSFLVADEKFKNLERERLQSRELPFLSLIKVSFYVGVTSTLVNLPFDMAKTQMQQAHYAPETNVFKVMARVMKTTGLRGLYAGWNARMLQYMIQSVFTVTLLEKLEQKWRA